MHVAIYNVIIGGAQVFVGRLRFFFYRIYNVQYRNVINANTIKSQTQIVLSKPFIQ